MADRYVRDRLSAPRLRTVARAMNRTNTNVVTIEYDPGEAADYVDSHWAVPPEDPS